MLEQDFLYNLNNNQSNYQENREQNLLKEKIIDAYSGSNILCCSVLFICILILSIIGIIRLLENSIAIAITVFLVIFGLFFLCFIFSGFFTNEINVAHIFIFFGKYYGTVKKMDFYG